MWYRDTQAVIALERRIAGIEEASDDPMQKLIWDCSITPGAMFARAVVKKS